MVDLSIVFRGDPQGLLALTAGTPWTSRKRFGEHLAALAALAALALARLPPGRSLKNKKNNVAFGGENWRQRFIAIIICYIWLYYGYLMAISWLYYCMLL